MDNHKQKISHLKALYHLACADNVLTKAETIYIKKVAEHLGVGEHELSSFTGAEPDLELPDQEYKIYALFHRLAIVVMIDNELSEVERTYCFNLGVKMGLHPNAIGEIIDLIEVKGAIGTMPGEIIAIFKKYQN
jgi:hypothetical protein